MIYVYIYMYLLQGGSFIFNHNIHILCFMRYAGTGVDISKPDLQRAYSLDLLRAQLFLLVGLLRVISERLLLNICENLITWE